PPTATAVPPAVASSSWWPASKALNQARGKPNQRRKQGRKHENKKSKRGESLGAKHLEHNGRKGPKRHFKSAKSFQLLGFRPDRRHLEAPLYFRGVTIWRCFSHAPHKSQFNIF